MVKIEKKCHFFGGVQSTVLYAHYGEESDFTQLQKSNINVDGKVMLVRAGKISFAEKVGVFVQKRIDCRFISSLVLTCENFDSFSFSSSKQVANAARVNASAVLIYPDRDDFNFEESEDTTELFGHVSVKTRHIRLNSV